MIGYASALKKLFGDASFSDETNDQCWLHETLGKHWRSERDWALDVRSSLFLEHQSLTTSGVRTGVGPEALVADGDRYRVVAPGGAVGLEERPTFIHLDSTPPPVEALERFYTGLYAPVQSPLAAVGRLGRRLREGIADSSVCPPDPMNAWNLTCSWASTAKNGCELEQLGSN